MVIERKRSASGAPVDGALDVPYCKKGALHRLAFVSASARREGSDIGVLGRFNL